MEAYTYAGILLIYFFTWQASQDHLISHVLPMLVRAYDDTDARLQEEVLKKTIPLAKRLDVQVIVSCNMVDNFLFGVLRASYIPFLL